MSATRNRPEVDTKDRPNRSTANVFTDTDKCFFSDSIERSIKIKSSILHLDSKEKFPDAGLDSVNVSHDESKNCHSIKCNDVFIKGNLKRHISFWQNINAHPMVLDVIENGYKIPFISEPDSKVFKNNRSALDNSDFVLQEISELLKSGCIKQVSYTPRNVNPLSVATQRSGKKRLILDLRFINKHIYKQHVKFEDWRVAQQYIQKDGFMINFDLKQGYTHIDIHPQYHTYLGFAWSIKGKTHYFIYTVIPYGINVGPYIFTKVMRQLIKHWRSKGVPICIFLDDGFATAGDVSRCIAISHEIQSDLKCAGLVANDKKSTWIPSQHLEWVGLVFDLVQGTISLPVRRVEAINTLLLFCLRNISKISARTLSKATGNIISCSPVIGSLTRLMTRAMYGAINQKQSWDMKMDLSRNLELCEELQFWLDNINAFKERVLFERRVPHIMCYSDSSDSALGAYIKGQENCVAHIPLSVEESNKSSSFRELKALEFGLVSFRHQLANRVIKWFTDAQNVVSIFNHGSKLPELQQIALRIFRFCLQNKINIEVEWIPRAQNERADLISRIKDHNDWGVSPSFFEKIDRLWGPHTIDRFANFKNKKIQRFNSLFWNPDCEGVDAFSFNWQNENNWLVPPIHLVIKAVKHARACNAKGTLIVPRWQSAIFYCYLFPRGNMPLPGIERVLEFPCDGIYIIGDNKNSLFGSPNFKSTVLAVKFDFSR